MTDGEGGPVLKALALTLAVLILGTLLVLVTGWATIPAGYR